MSLPDIKDDKDAVDAINELKHALKGRHQFKGITPIADILDMALNVVIEECGLGGDQHIWAEYKGPKGMDPDLEARVQKILSSTKRGAA